ncbi:MAG: tetratricopeptide repeat protein [Phycisphaerales bacterium]
MLGQGSRNVIRVAAMTAVLAAAPMSLGQASVGLGGVRAAGPGVRGGTPLSRTGTLLPAAPSRPAFAPSSGWGSGFSSGSGFRSGGSFGECVVGGNSVGGSFDQHIDGRGFVSGSGLSVNGEYRDDHFNLRFRLGTPTGLIHKDLCRPIIVGSHHLHYPYWPYSYGSYWYERTTPIDGYYLPVDPALVGYTARPNPPAAPAADPPTDHEIGDWALQLGYAARAITAYKAHLDANPEDAEVTRLLGLAMIADRNVTEGVAIVALAYRQDATLAERPLADDIFGGRSDLRAQVERVSNHARRVKTASAWLAMAALVQAQGKADVAARLVERARGVGLDAGVADTFIGVLSRKQ